VSPSRLPGSAGARLSLAVVLAFTFACTDEVPLGSFGVTTGTGGLGSAGAAGSGGASTAGQSSAGRNPGGEGGGGAGAGAEICLAPGIPGQRNNAGPGVGTTNTNTDWYWPNPFSSLEWDLTIERTNVKDGYFWAHQFGFVNSVGGFLGVQINGGYQAEPPDGPYERCSSSGSEARRSTPSSATSPRRMPAPSCAWTGGSSGGPFTPSTHS
jgi:hypothetical protein